MTKTKVKKGDQLIIVDEQLMEEQPLTEQVASATANDESWPYPLSWLISKQWISQ